MSTHKPRKSSGRVAFDEQGNATWEWLSETGRFIRDIDTQKLKTIAADLSCDGSPAPSHAPPDDPYNRSTLPSRNQRHAKKRTLDDMRRLSDEIKAAREKKSRE